MHWFQRNLLKVVTVLAVLSFLLPLVVVVPVATAEAQPGLVTLGQSRAIDATPTVDATVTALNKEKLRDDVAQGQHTLGNWFWNSGAALISSLALALAAVLAIIRYFGDRATEQEKRTEERFQKVVTDLGSERKESRIAAAILLRTFLRPDYEQFYRQVFDLAIAYLQPLGDHILTSETVPLDPLRQALITVFKESFKRVRGEWREQKPKSFDFDHEDYDRLGGVNIQLDEAYLVKADLRGAWMREASLRKAHLYQAKFTGAHLKGVNFTDAYLEDTQLVMADLTRANFTQAKLLKADFREAEVSRANFIGADMTGANPEAAISLKDTDLRGVTGLTKEQLLACKAKGAIIDEGIVATPSLSPLSAPASSQSNHGQVPSTPPANVDGNSTSSQSSA